MRYLVRLKGDVIRAIAGGASVHRIAHYIAETADRSFPMARAKAIAELAMIFKIPHRHAHVIISEFWID